MQVIEVYIISYYNIECIYGLKDILDIIIQRFGEYWEFNFQSIQKGVLLLQSLVLSSTNRIFNPCGDSDTVLASQGLQQIGTAYKISLNDR